jgi:chaperonin cofactor prefoldin
MALTIGVRRYSSSADLRALCADRHFLRVLGAALDRIRDPGERERAEARGKAKLKKWVTKDAKYLVPIGAKGQGKSFPSYETAVTWLLYKTRKTFANNQERESRLAEEVHGNAKIRKLLFDFLRGPLAAWWAGLDKEKKATVGKMTGRYSHFYSKLFASRTIREGFEYFGVGGGGFFSKTVTEANLSISEAAAFLADAALAARKGDVNFETRMIKNVDTIRYNLTQVDQKTRQALDEAFHLLSSERGGMFEENRNETYVNNLERNLRRIRERRGRMDYPRTVAMVFGDIKGTIRGMIDEDEYLETIAPEAIRFVNTGKALYEAVGKCKELADMETFLESADLKTYLGKKRPKITTRLGALKSILQAQLDADADKTPELLKDRKPALYTKVRRLGEKNSDRSEYNVDPDHEWTSFMISHDAVVGAGPSGTTSITLGFVALACKSEGGRVGYMSEYAVAMALFSFWQRKKKLLKYQASVHTWNEVCTALDHHRGTDTWKRLRDGFLQVSATGMMNGDAGCNLYEYPSSFNNFDGRPVYNAGVVSFADLLGGD